MPRKNSISSASEFILGRNTKNPFETSFNPSGKPKRDQRRAFTKTQKNELLYQQDGKCASARCHHKKLDPRATQFDHKKPWVSGGRTIRKNGRALCSECHSIITHNQRLRKTEKKQKPKNTSAFF